MAESKVCEVCGNLFEKRETACSRTDWGKRRFCSQACKAASQRGKAPWNKGKTLPKTAPRHPCRICGQPTKYRASDRKLAGLVHCDRPECIEASRVLKNERIRAGNLRAIAEGRKTNAHGWRNVRTISPEEESLTPWFVSLGWTPQYVVAVGTIGGYQLDFAHLDRLLYVEIDGTSHRARGRRERDAHRDAVLAAHGWRGLRIAAHEVASDPERVKADILRWIALQQ